MTEKQFIEETVELLKGIEWRLIDDDGENLCPECGAVAIDGHFADCVLNRIMQAGLELSGRKSWRPRLFVSRHSFADGTLWIEQDTPTTYRCNGVDGVSATIPRPMGDNGSSWFEIPPAKPEHKVVRRYIHRDQADGGGYYFTEGRAGGTVHVWGPEDNGLVDSPWTAKQAANFLRSGIWIAIPVIHEAGVDELEPEGDFMVTYNSSPTVVLAGRPVTLHRGGGRFEMSLNEFSQLHRMVEAKKKEMPI